jgi:eukaryotic-like serine/threonine-protein kinase
MRDDLQRYLDHRPVMARPDTLTYRFVKLARRRPWLVPIVLIGFLALAAYMTTVTLYSRQLEFEKQRALAAETFMVNLLESPDPFAPADPERGSSITVVEALDLGVERLRAEEVDDVALRATLMDSIAGVYASLDQHDKAIELGEESLALERSLFGDESAEVLDSLSMLAGQYQASGDYLTALRYRNEESMLARRLYSDSDPRMGAAEANAAGLQISLGNIDEGRHMYATAIEKLRRTPEASARPLINALVGLSGLLDTESPEDAAALLEEAEALAIELFGSQSLSMALIHARAGTTASNQRRFEESESAFRAALEIYESRLGRAHGATISTLNNLAVLLMRKGDLTGAETAFRELLQLSENKYGTDHTLAAGHSQNLATVIGRQGRFAEALPLHWRAYDIFSETLPDHYQTAFPLISIAYAELQIDNPAAAEHAARGALTRLSVSENNAYASGVSKCILGLALERQGFAHEGAILLSEAKANLRGLPVDPVYQNVCRL